MYNGEKDWRPPITVPASLCFLRILSGKRVVEVRIPDKNAMEAVPIADGDRKGYYINWKSFIVQPNQVYHKTRTENIIEGITQNSKVKLYSHFDFGANIYYPDSNSLEEVDNFEIQRRISEYYREL